jgi:hypothetical protein
VRRRHSRKIRPRAITSLRTKTREWLKFPLMPSFSGATAVPRYPLLLPLYHSSSSQPHPFYPPRLGRREGHRRGPLTPSYEDAQCSLFYCVYPSFGAELGFVGNHWILLYVLVDGLISYRCKSFCLHFSFYFHFHVLLFPHHPTPLRLFSFLLRYQCSE